MINLAILVVGGLTYLILRSLINTYEIEIPTVFAGSPNGKDTTVRKISTFVNNPIYKDGDIEINVSNLTPLSVDGHSLEPLGIKDKSILFVDTTISEYRSDLNKLIGRFVIFEIDGIRTLSEYPLSVGVVTEGLKARKVVKIIKSDLNKDAATAEIQTFLMDNDSDGSQCDADLVDETVAKYTFASNFYKSSEDSIKNLIMSVTYKNGKDKKYSFHSEKFLYGVVKYYSVQ